MSGRYDALVFDLLTALIDSWTLWSAAAGSPADGLRWRRKYLELTYRQGAYRPYEAIVRAAAEQSAVGVHCADELARRWDELPPWPEAVEVVGALRAASRSGCDQLLDRARPARRGALRRRVRGGRHGEEAGF